MPHLCATCKKASDCKISANNIEGMQLNYCITYEPVKNKSMKKYKLKPCPFCGSKSLRVEDFPNGRGAFISCDTADCALWSHRIPVNEWNRRAVSKSTLQKFLLKVETIYKPSLTDTEYNEYRCPCCNRSHKDPNKIRHSKNCIIGSVLEKM